MESSAPAAVMVTPSSDERFWSKLRDRVDTILHQRNPQQRCSPSSSPSSFPVNGFGTETGKRFREDSLLLIRGLDSAAASLSQLTSSLNAAQQGLYDLAKPSLTNLQQIESERKEDTEDAQPNSKRHCGANKLLNKDEETGCQKHHMATSQDEQGPGDSEEARDVSTDVGKSGNLKKAKNLAVSMASKASSLAIELKTIKSELRFMQERCALLEEENRRLRDGVEKGDRPEEDDLVRLQLEALLAEKSRLANENANLTRENQCLHQLVEYHQLATQDPSSPSYEQAIHGICLDFSSPLGKEDRGDSEDNNGCEESEYASAPALSTDKLELATRS